MRRVIFAGGLGAVQGGFETALFPFVFFLVFGTLTATTPEEGRKERILGFTCLVVPNLADDDLRSLFQVATDNLDLGPVGESRFDFDGSGKAVLVDPNRRPLA